MNIFTPRSLYIMCMLSYKLGARTCVDIHMLSKLKILARLHINVSGPFIKACKVRSAK